MRDGYRSRDKPRRRRHVPVVTIESGSQVRFFPTGFDAEEGYQPEEFGYYQPRTGPDRDSTHEQQDSYVHGVSHPSVRSSHHEIDCAVWQGQRSQTSAEVDRRPQPEGAPRSHQRGCAKSPGIVEVETCVARAEHHETDEDELHRYICPCNECRSRVVA